MAEPPPRLTPLSTTAELLRGDSSSRSAFVSTSDLSSRSAFVFTSDAGGIPVLGDGAVASSKREWELLPSCREGSTAELNRAFAQRHAKVGDALRDNEPPARLASAAYVGLALSSAAAGFCGAFLRYGYRPLLVAYLTLYHRNQFESARYLVEWPAALAVFVGLTSDAVPLFGYRRKSYIALGWGVTLAAALGIVVITLLSPTKFMLFVDSTKRGDAVATYTLESHPTRFAVLFVTLGVLVSVGLQVAWIVSLAKTVELAQREPLLVRGRLQSTYLLIYYSAAMLAKFFVSKVIFPSDDADEPLRADITLGEAGVVLCASSAIALPAVIFFLKDERVETASEEAFGAEVGSDKEAAKSEFQAGVHELLHFCHKEVVYRVIFFVCGIVLVLGFYNQNLRDAVARWSGVTATRANDLQFGQSVCVVVGIAFWRLFLVNASWQKLVIFGACFYVGCSAVLTVPTTYDWIRAEWFFLVLVSLQEIPKAWLKLFAVIPATEIAEVGCEGAAVGLVLSFQWLVYIASSTISTTLSQVIGTNVTKAQVEADAVDTRHATFVAAAVYDFINMLALALAPLLPAQKFETQQMLAVGRRNTRMGYVIGVTFVLLLLYDLVANIVMIQSSSKQSDSGGGA